MDGTNGEKGGQVSRQEFRDAFHHFSNMEYGINTDVNTLTI